MGSRLQIIIMTFCTITSMTRIFGFIFLLGTVVHGSRATLNLPQTGAVAARRNLPKRTRATFTLSLPGQGKPELRTREERVKAFDENEKREALDETHAMNKGEDHAMTQDRIKRLKAVNAVQSFTLKSSTRSSTRLAPGTARLYAKELSFRTPTEERAEKPTEVGSAPNHTGGFTIKVGDSLL